MSQLVTVLVTSIELTQKQFTLVLLSIPCNIPGFVYS